mmetsp:Transcript_5082/g.7983  ORF Transcript_5082/g.7983 Transcript_5082/m.7983 type:complete len:339 (-) Transcript_5082:323-1339(-)
MVRSCIFPLSFAISLFIGMLLGSDAASRSTSPQTSSGLSGFGSIAWKHASVTNFRLMGISTTTLQSILDARGGADNDEEESEDESESEDDDDDDLFDSFEDGEDSHFKEIGTGDQLIDAYKKTPPLTKAYLTACFAAASAGFLFSGNQFPPLLSLDWNKVLKGFQVWRPFTSFLNIGTINIWYLMSLQFVWMYMGGLERLFHNKPYDFWIMILFGMVSMIVGYPTLKLDARFLGHNLSTYLVYIWSRMHEGVDVVVLELFHTRAEILPWFMLAQTFLLEGELPWLDFFGIVFGHIYYHLKTVGLLRAPKALQQWYEKSPSAKGIRNQYKEVSSDFLPV